MRRFLPSKFEGKPVDILIIDSLYSLSRQNKMLTRNATIPLFPLDVVLFPGMMLPLHIFEERYKIMIKECLANDRCFGVILAKNNRAKAPNVVGVRLGDIHMIGTLAYITAVDVLPEGRMHLIAMGQERFVIKDIYPADNDFLMGRVDPLDLPQTNPEFIAQMTARLRPLVKRYIQHLGEMAGKDLSHTLLPGDPEELTFWTGAAMQGPLSDKQKLLSSRSLDTLIAKTVSMLDKEDQILVYMLRAYKAHQQNAQLSLLDFSLN